MPLFSNEYLLYYQFKVLWAYSILAYILGVILGTTASTSPSSPAYSPTVSVAITLSTTHPRDRKASTMPSKSSKAVDTTLIVSEAVLSALGNAAGFAPIPFLREAAGSALSILQAVQVSIASPWSPRYRWCSNKYRKQEVTNQPSRASLTTPVFTLTVW